MNELITIENGLPVLNEAVAEELLDIGMMLKSLKEREESLKTQIMNAMEAHNIIKVETPEVLLTYVPQTDRETLDSKALKSECPDVYDAYCKLTKVRPSLRVKVR